MNSGIQMIKSLVAESAKHHSIYCKGGEGGKKFRAEKICFTKYILHSDMIMLLI